MFAAVRSIPLRTSVSRSGQYAVSAARIGRYTFPNTSGQGIPRAMIARNMNSKVNGQYQEVCIEHMLTYNLRPRCWH